MADEHLVGRISQIPPGEGRNFEVAGVRLAVFHTRAGAVHATQAECPHRGGPLADGLTDEAGVVCPLHDRVYNFGTGLGPDCAIATYPVRLGAGGEILVSVTSLRPTIFRSDNGRP